MIDSRRQWWPQSADEPQSSELVGYSGAFKLRMRKIRTEGGDSLTSRPIGGESRPEEVVLNHLNQEHHHMTDVSWA